IFVSEQVGSPIKLYRELRDRLNGGMLCAMEQGDISYSHDANVRKPNKEFTIAPKHSIIHEIKAA
ncbi:1304_t:CDS:1, partial [Ambispora leptoticha]